MPGAGMDISWNQLHCFTVLMVMPSHAARRFTKASGLIGSPDVGTGSCMWHSDGLGCNAREVRESILVERNSRFRMILAGKVLIAKFQAGWNWRVWTRCWLIGVG